MPTRQRGAATATTPREEVPPQPVGHEVVWIEIVQVERLLQRRKLGSLRARSPLRKRAEDLLRNVARKREAQGQLRERSHRREVSLRSCRGYDARPPSAFHARAQHWVGYCADRVALAQRLEPRAQLRGVQLRLL